MRSLFAASILLFAGACASTTTDTAPTTQQAVVPNSFDLAMSTVDGLVAAGNEQIAIDRLTQLLGNPDLTPDELAATLMRRGELRYGDGDDLMGAIQDFEELTARYPDSALVESAELLLEDAVMEHNALTNHMMVGGLSPTEEFEILFRLGRHQDAADLMLSRNLQPGNGYLVDMYQVGYLCDDPELTGPSYDMVALDGTTRTLRFCEFGK